MKVKLLSDGGFGPAMKRIEFPQIVDAEYDSELLDAVNVPVQELIRIGGNEGAIMGSNLKTLTFIAGEFEVIE